MDMFTSSSAKICQAQYDKHDSHMHHTQNKNDLQEDER